MCSFLSGVLVWGNLNDGLAAWTYSLTYNGSYMPVSYTHLPLKPKKDRCTAQRSFLLRGFSGGCFHPPV